MADPSRPLPPPSDDPFLVLARGKEGGFVSLEEIDESQYAFIGGAFEPLGGEENKKNKKRDKKNASSSFESKKRKRGGESESSAVEDDDGGEKETEKKRPMKKKKKKNSRNKKKSNQVEASENGENKDGLVEEGKVEGDVREELLLREDEVYAWKELRLHPLLIKSIRRLGFREPTPIQKACIPAAAHQGKDVIGAAETGSGKTLAFGLPILQRFLDEREKVARSVQEDAKSAEERFKGGPLRALIVTPTRELALQVCDHLIEAAKFLDVQVVPIVGGMSMEKQERLLKRRPEIIVGTPGRLWELMSAGDQHLTELHSLSFLVLDEADRMIEYGHFHELQSIIDMLPVINSSGKQSVQSTPNCETMPILQRKKRQTFVFSATIALSDNFRKKLKRGLSTSKLSMPGSLSSIETLSERAGMRPDAAIVDLTNAAIVANKLEQSFIECGEEDKDAYLYYMLSVHGQGRTMVFCTSIAALRHISSLLRILDITSWTLHAQMQQRARLKAIDRFRGNENGVLVATDVAARGLDIPHVRTVVHYQLPHSAEVYIHRSGRTARASADGCCIALISPSDKTKFYSLCKSLSKAIDRFRGNENGVLVATDVAARGLDIPHVRTVVHYQLPHSAEVYIHRSGRTARASADGCCIALISPSDKTKFYSLCKSLSKETLRQFPIDDAYMPEESAKKNWLERNAESVEVALEVSDNEEERVKSYNQKKITSGLLKKLQQELNDCLARPLQPKSFSHRFLAGAGVSPLLQQQLEVLSKRRSSEKPSLNKNRRSGLFVIGQDCVEPLQALRSAGHEVCVNVEKKREMQILAEQWKRKRREEKKRSRAKEKGEEKIERGKEIKELSV
ncbi:DEAD-box ATP-dependent RNA helicase 13 [Ananas comosus]|uniref:ATP-dependent RNA helicase n=1 Tax=Ananas comosus TaxID=4615 RepID=A0A199V4P9_ANACO|nr:DEAD-box ATP-dependent RNA helicase 13 [Ananas comosus]